LLAPRPTLKLEDTPCQLSVTAYSIYSQLPSISRGRLLHPQPEDAPCRGARAPHSYTIQKTSNCFASLKRSKWF